MYIKYLGPALVLHQHWPMYRVFCFFGAGMVKRHKHNTAENTITQCCFNDVPVSKTVGQH